MNSLLREPLLHFLLIGAALFVVFGLLNNPAGPGSERIVITPGQIDFLKANFTRTWQRPPTEMELQGLVDSFVREEILYREALALGLDRDDKIIRRRLKQKLEFMSDDLAEVATPSDEELRQFLQSRPEIFRREPQVAFRHIFLDSNERGKGAFDEADRLLEELTDDNSKPDPDILGDTLMLPMSFDLTTVSQISRLFGKSFGQELLSVEPGKWTGPIRSGYGIHLVMITDRIDERLPELDEIRDVVEREWVAVRKKELKESIYNKLRDKYTVVFEQPANEKKPLQAVSEAQAAQETQQ
jgi:hypothetical protein